MEGFEYEAEDVFWKGAVLGVCQRNKVVPQQSYKKVSLVAGWLGMRGGLDPGVLVKLLQQ